MRFYPHSAMHDLLPARAIPREFGRLHYARRHYLPRLSPRILPVEARLTAALAIALLAGVPRGAGAAEPLSFEDASANLRGDHPEERSRDIGWNGAAWFDFDRDGLLDLFVARATSQSNALFRNLGDDGKELGSGVYFFRLRTDRGVAARKLLILR